MRIQISLLIFSIALLTTPILAQEKVATKKFEHAGFSIMQPVTWTSDISGDAGSTFILYSPIISPDDTFSDNINLLEQGLPADQADLDKYIEMSIKQLPAFFTNLQLIKQEKEKRSKKECYILEYSGEMNGFALHFIQYIWVIKGKAIILTFTATPYDFEALKTDALKAMDSFKLKL